MYEPQEDSEFIKEIASKFAYGKVLDMGCGTGIIGNEVLKQNAKSVDFVDVNSDAVEFCKRNIKTEKKVRFIVSDLFNNINERYDTITFNAPYLPGNYEEDIELFAGKNGYEIILKFLEEAPFHLKDNGIIVLLLSELSKPQVIRNFLNNNLMTIEQEFSRRLFFEEHYVWIIKKNKLRKELDKIFRYKFFSKGKHSIIFKTNKGTLLKVNNGVGRGIDKERKILKELSDLEFVPEIISFGKDWFEMNMFQGERFDYFWKKYEDGQISREQVRKVLRELVNELIILDKKRIKKEELNRPNKNIIVFKDKVFLIDFERAHKGIGNLTEFFTFLFNHAQEFIADKNKKEIVNMLRTYKRNPYEDIVKLLR